MKHARTLYWGTSSIAGCACPVLHRGQPALSACVRSIQLFGGKHKPWHFVENWLLRTLSWQVGFMKNGKVKSLEVSYYSNGGNSADLSHGVSKIFWWLIKQKVFFCATFCPDFRDLLPYSTACTCSSLTWLKTDFEGVLELLQMLSEPTDLPWHVPHNSYGCCNNSDWAKGSRMFAFYYRGLWWKSSCTMQDDW